MEGVTTTDSGKPFLSLQKRMEKAPMCLRKARISLMVAAFAYTWLLEWVYVHSVANTFGYLGYTSRPLPGSVVAAMYAIAVLPSMWMPTTVNRPSFIVYWFLYLLVFIPATIVPFRALSMPPSQVLPLTLSLLSSMLLLRLAYAIPVGYLRPQRSTKHGWMLVVCTMAMTLYVIVIFVFGCNLKIVPLTSAYNVRSVYKSGLSRAGRLAGYAVPWLGSVLNPLLMSTGFARHRVWLIMIGFIGQSFLYSTGGFKTPLFSVFLIAALFILLKLRKWNLWFVLTVGLIMLILACLGIDSVTTGNFLVSLFVRRFILTPGLLTGFYFEFFSRNPKALLGHSILKGFVQYPYSLPPPLVIGQVYFGNPEMSANANIWADAYANFGYLGILGCTILVAGVFWIFDTVSRDKDYYVVRLSLGVPAWDLCNSALLTSILTGGIGLLVFLVWVMPSHRVTEAPRGSQRKGGTSVS